MEWTQKFSNELKTERYIFFGKFYQKIFMWKMWKKCEKCEKNVKKKIWIKYKPDLNSINYVKIMRKKY